MTHDQVEGVPIGQHPLVTRLLKGVYNLRPPQPRYSDTWNVDMVIRHLQSLGNNSILTLKVLGQKLALLMALVEVSRSSELHALDVCYKVFKPEGMLFSLPTLTIKRRLVEVLPSSYFLWLFPRTNISVANANCQFGEGPRGLKASWNYMSEMSKCDTALPPTLCVALFFPFS